MTRALTGSGALAVAWLVTLSSVANAQSEPASAPATVSASASGPEGGAGSPHATDAVAAAAASAPGPQVTPIVADPKNPTHPAFQLYAELDLPVLGIGAVFAAARLIRTQQAFCAPLCDPNDLNALDRTVAGFYSPGWATASNVGLYGAMAAAAGVLLVDEGALDTLNDAVVVSEAALSATAVSSMLTLAAGRPRPYLFGTDAPLSERNSAGASLSFLSSHAAVTSAIALSTFMTMKRLHPHSTTPYWILAAGSALSLFVATARVMAGEHFITDSVGGLVVGTSVGVLVPALHASPLKIVPIVSGGERGVGVSGAF